MPRRIIVNADDLGLCTSVNTAIFEVFRAGNLSSATLMVNMPGTRDAVDRLRDHPGLAVGLHFCITEGRALSGVSTLTDEEGRFMDRSALAKAAFRGHVELVDIRRELEAQFARAAEMGVRLTHVDSHQHVLMLPPVFEAAVAVLTGAGLPIRIVHPPLRTLTSDLARPLRVVRQLANLFFAQRIRSRWLGASNHRLVSIHDLPGAGPYDAATFRRLVQRTGGAQVTELMVHPYILGEDLLSLYSDELDRKTPFLKRCAAEYQALKGERIFTQEELITYADLMGR
ncbi:MAG: ChbG/HpnK family deacetylase [Flavobacteriales bacterium]|nr:ChbG/HpnK family deacetylase [Flavobacteriales bacterium]